MKIPKIDSPDEFVSYLGGLFMLLGLGAIVMGNTQVGGAITLMGLCIMLVGLLRWERRKDYERGKRK